MMCVSAGKSEGEIAGEGMRGLDQEGMLYGGWRGDVWILLPQ